MDDKAIKCIFLGYNVKSKGYKLYEPSTRRVVISRDVIFDKTSSMPLWDCKFQSTLGVSDIFGCLVPLLGYDAYDDAPPGTSSPSSAHLQPHTQSGQPHVLTKMPPAAQDIVEEAVEQELAEIRQPKRAPRWLFETLKDNKLDAPLHAQVKFNYSCFDCYSM